MSKLLKLLFILPMVGLIVNCGSSATSSTDGATVEVVGTDGSSSAASSLSAVQTTGDTSNVLVLASRVCLAAGTDTGDGVYTCPEEDSADWNCIFDNTGDTDVTGQCVDEPDAGEDSDFTNLAEAQTMGESSSFTEGTYNCVMVSLCNRLVWQADEDIDDSIADVCSGDQINDISPSSARDGLGDGETPEPDFYSYYWAVGGTDPTTLDDESEDDDSVGEDPETPFALTSAITIVAGSNTITFTMSNKEDRQGWEGTYNDEAPEGEECSVEAPTMTVE